VGEQPRRLAHKAGHYVKGADLIALTIREIGRKLDIATVENVPLARALYRSVDIEQEIPIELYMAVAEVLAFVFKAQPTVAR
jgi:flagellar biosynthesis protein FlhB